DKCPSPNLPPFTVSVAGHINHNRAGEDQNVVLAIRDVHAIGISEGKPLLGDGCNNFVTAGKRVLPVQEIAFRLQVVRAGNIDIEGVMKRSEQLLLNYRHELSIPEELVSPTPRKNFLLDERELVPLEILKGKLIADRQKFSVDEINISLVLIADVKVISQREKFLL
ncbi:MAG: hypothetical protein ABJC63_11900, partial [Gemmatimonadales bacterium]